MLVIQRERGILPLSFVVIVEVHFVIRFRAGHWLIRSAAEVRSAACRRGAAAFVVYMDSFSVVPLGACAAANTPKGLPFTYVTSMKSATIGPSSETGSHDNRIGPAICAPAVQVAPPSEDVTKPTSNWQVFAVQFETG